VEYLKKMTEIEKFRESEETYKIIFEGATDGILVADVKTKRFVLANPKICEIIGYSLKELLKLGVADIHPEKDLSHALDEFAKLTEERITLVKDLPILRKDKKVVYCDISGKIMEIEKQKYLVGFFRDITEWKKTEEELKDSEKRLSTILDAIQIGIMIIDAETHNIIDVNPIAAKMIDAPEEKIIGLMCHKYVCPAEKGKCPITDLGQKVDNSERVLLKVNGERMPIIKTVTPIILKDRKCLLESFIDITNYKKMEEELKSKVEELERFSKLAVGRELKMIELKKMIKELEDKLNNKKGMS
jgi:PAS domain S-box-containing protein